MPARDLLNWSIERRYCSICDRSCRFRPFGDPPRPNAQCSRCGSLERHRALWAWLEPQLRPRLRVLHAAPEQAIYGKLRQRAEVEYVTTEIEPDAHARDPNLVRADLQDLPFADASFDLVICCHVLEHVEDDRRAMQEIRRVLAAQGVAAIQVPTVDRDETFEDAAITTPAGRRQAFGQGDHVRLYGLDFDDRLRTAAFEVTLVAAGHPSSDIHVARPVLDRRATRR